MSAQSTKDRAIAAANAKPSTMTTEMAEPWTAWFATVATEALAAYVKRRYAQTRREVQVMKQWTLVHGRRLHAGKAIRDAWCLIDDESASKIVYDPSKCGRGCGIRISRSTRPAKTFATPRTKPRGWRGNTGTSALA